MNKEKRGFTGEGIETGGHFLYSCLLLFIIEIQAVTYNVCKRWLVEQNFRLACNFILTLHPFSYWILHICCFRLSSSLGKRWSGCSKSHVFNAKRRSSDRFAQHLFHNSVNSSTAAESIFCWFLKDNPLIFRLFQNFSIPLPEIRYISCQEMKRFAQRDFFSSPLSYSIILSTFRLALSTRALSNHFR